MQERRASATRPRRGGRALKASRALAAHNLDHNWSI